MPPLGFILSFYIHKSRRPNWKLWRVLSWPLVSYMGGYQHYGLQALYISYSLFTALGVWTLGGRRGSGSSSSNRHSSQVDWWNWTFYIEELAKSRKKACLSVHHKINWNNFQWNNRGEIKMKARIIAVNFESED